MSVLKQLKGITKRTIKYLTKDIYDVNSDKHLDEIIQELKSGNSSGVPIMTLRFETGQEMPFNIDDLDELFDYIENNFTLDNIKLPAINMAIDTLEGYQFVIVSTVMTSKDLKTVGLNIDQDSLYIITKTDNGYNVETQTI